MSEINSFLQLSQEINQRLNQLNINQATPVQNEIIPRILKGENIIFQSETGTGKTFAYLLPLIDRLEKDQNKTDTKIFVHVSQRIQARV